MHGVEDRVPFIFGGEALGDGKISCLICVGVKCGFYLIECPSGEPWWQEGHFSLRYISIRRSAYHKEKTQLFVQTKPLQRRCNAWEDPVSTQIKSYMRWRGMSLTRHVQPYMKVHWNPPKAQKSHEHMPLTISDTGDTPSPWVGPQCTACGNAAWLAS